MLKFDELPSTPLNDRIMVLPDQPVEKTDGGLHIPDVAMRVATVATIMDAGLRARDVMYDNGDQVGDKVLFGQFAGVWEEWDRIVTEGKDPKCAHAEWAYAPKFKGFRRVGYSCTGCGAERVNDAVLVMNVGDILANVTKAARIRAGEIVLVKAQGYDGKTTHVYRRPDEIVPELTVSTPATATMSNGANKHAA